MKFFFNDRNKFFQEAKAAIQNVNIVLDIGSGIRPQLYIQPLMHICCEPYHEYIEFLVKNNKNIVAIQATWEHIVEIMPEKSVDSIFLLDVIEHLPKEIGTDLLNKTLKIARYQVIIFTPLGYVKQHHKDGKDAWGFHGVEWQEHHSGWFPKDFNENWDVYICEKYHEHDNLGQKLLEPFGAFWAIWNNGENKMIANKEESQFIEQIDRDDNNIKKKMNGIVNQEGDNLKAFNDYKMLNKIERLVNQEIKNLMNLLRKIKDNKNKGGMMTRKEILDILEMFQTMRDCYKNIDNYMRQQNVFNKQLIDKNNKK